MINEQSENRSIDNISDEEFLKNYEKHHKTGEKSSKYDKKNQSGEIKAGFWFFLAFVFITAYFLFTKFLFIPVR